MDIAVTEKANNEVASSLLKRAVVNGATRALSQSTSSERTITNLDLGQFRNRLLASETAYEKRRKELGLPLVEESRRVAVDLAERTHEQLLSAMQEDQQAESDWRTWLSVVSGDEEPLAGV